MGVPVIGWNHGGVQETLAELFPAGAVAPGDRKDLLERARAFLHERPEVVPNPAFGLNESMEKTFAVYQSLRTETS